MSALEHDQLLEM
jgi:hypothetical protein